MLARIGARGSGEADQLTLREVHRFDNEPVHLCHRDQRASGPQGSEPGGRSLHWDVVGLFREVVSGLRAAARALPPGERIAGIGIDTWAVDYGLLDGRGELLGTPYCYRDSRTAAGVTRVHQLVSPQELYARG